ncbi:MAG: DNA-binding protein [Glaciihabitans sp.]|nr:DNA-binding protein [Glaciihabitans sp.]
MAIPDALVGKATVELWPTVGQLLTLGKNSTYAAAARGDIPTLRIGGRIVVPVAPLLELLGIRDQS